MLDLDVCRWDHIVLGLSARSHVDAAARAGAHGRLVQGRNADLWRAAWRWSTCAAAARRRGLGLHKEDRLSNGTYRPIYDAARRLDARR